MTLRRFSLLPQQHSIMIMILISVISVCRDAHVSMITVCHASLSIERTEVGVL